MLLIEKTEKNDDHNKKIVALFGEGPRIFFLVWCRHFALSVVSLKTPKHDPLGKGVYTLDGAKPGHCV